MALAAVAVGAIAVGAIASAAGAAADAKAAKKAIKAKRDADLKVLKADTEAVLASLEADTTAQQQVIASDANAKIAALMYEAATEGQNVEIARLMGRDALQRGLLDEWSFRRDASQVQGQQRSRLAGSGVDVNSGSAAWLQEEMIVATDLDALAIRQNAGREAYGYEVEAYGASRRQGLANLEATSTADVANANIKGLRDVAKVKAEGIRKTSKANEEAIREVASAGVAGISPARSAALSALGSASSFAASWYLSGAGGR